MANPRPVILVTIVLAVLVAALAAWIALHRGAASTSTPVARSWTYGQRVIVQVADSLHLPYVDGADASLSGTPRIEWDAIEAGFHGVHLLRLFTRVPADTLRAWGNAARAHDPHYREPPLTTFYAVDTPSGQSADSLRMRLRTVSFVVTAYPELEPSVASCPSGDTDDPHNTDSEKQLYLGYDLGLDVREVWKFGASGENVHFVDLESGWDDTIPDIPFSQPIIGTSARDMHHGSAVLGIVCAKDDASGCVGVAPCCTTSLASCYQTPTQPIYLGDVVTAVDAMSPRPNVLLIEMQEPFLTDVGRWEDLPAETDPAIRTAIHLCVYHGITVVEVAGNGSHDLDKVLIDGQHPFVRPNPDGIDDSGAILVAGANPTQPITRSTVSNFGSRIDCFAWGRDVFSVGPAGQNSAGKGIFHGTSAAGAIVAGAAVSLTSLAKAHGVPLTPDDARTWLTDPHCGRGSTDPIGVMPFLRSIASLHNLNHVP